MEKILVQYKLEMQEELEKILSFWQQNMIDEAFGGFYGRMDHQNKIVAKAPKGSVLNARILWTFSSAFIYTNNNAYLQMAQRSFQYLEQFFIDKVYGGVYWTVDHRGNTLDHKKQVYASAFALYGLSEFYKCNQNEEVKKKAIDLYEHIVIHSFDKINGGYLEAFSRDWTIIDDVRLSDKDANTKKSMNTHLHVLEAFANLYKVWPDADLKTRITELLNVFLTRIIDPRMNFLHLFFNEDWQVVQGPISFGHNVEAAWLLQEAAEIIGDELLIQKVKEAGMTLINTSMMGLDNDGGLWYEYDLQSHSLVKEKHWWPQAESMIGFLNAWQNSGDPKYFSQSIGAWLFIKKYLKDNQNGEWCWGVRQDYSLMAEDKAGLWKGPYHNGRACLEVARRIDRELLRKSLF